MSFFAQQKHPLFDIQSVEPFNGSAPLSFIVQETITQQDLFFVRSHGSVPTIDPATFRLTVAGLVRQPLALSLEDLRTRFPWAEVTSTVQCAGNRRSELHSIAPIEDELQWDASAISTACWGGVRLRDVLIAAGVGRQARHVAFSGLDEIERDGQTFGFGGSIPYSKALMPDCLLALEMNAEPLPVLHGAPLRLVVPGYIGARNVKWLSHITVQMEPSDNYFQQRAYKLFPPETTRENVRWEQGIMLGETSLNAVICFPNALDTVPTGRVSLLGYAIGDGYNRVERVDVSVDGGQTWQPARFLSEAENLWTWRLWLAEVDLGSGATHLIARATDAAGNTQPKDTQEVWNFKGYSNNAWHRVPIQIQP